MTFRSFYLASTILSSAAAFLVANPSFIPTEAGYRPKPIKALIYGWDEDGDDDMTPLDTTIRYESEVAQCSVEGVEVAETISVDPNRLGSLARLAVHFSPLDRRLQLDQIERVNILCVSHNHIDIQAVICEDGGCVSLAVPIKFPKVCDLGGHLEGCVIGHLEDFDETATSVLSTAGGDEELLDTNTEVRYPYWWESPMSYEMVSECKSMCSILNDDEFQPEVLALAQDAMQKDGQGLTAISAKVASIGPAGFYFKVRARAWDSSVKSLDAFSPFGGKSMQNPDELRAAVLGTVATAGQPTP